MNYPRTIFITYLAAAFLVPRASAHEFWLQPSSYQPQPNSVVRLTLHLGERFAGRPVPYDPDRIEKFFVLGPDGEGPVAGRSGGTEAFAHVTSPGSYIVSYRSTRAYNEMAPNTFAAYLLEEGLASILKDRKRRSEQDDPGREAFSRCAKTLLTIGGAVLRDQRLGLPVEIVLDARRAATGLTQAQLVTRVFYDSKPLSGTRVIAVSQSHPENLIIGSTDEQGRVSFALPQPGVWMLTTIHMVRAPEELDADWESFWASSTFEIPQVDHSQNARPGDCCAYCTRVSGAVWGHVSVINC